MSHISPNEAENKELNSLDPTQTTDDITFPSENLTEETDIIPEKKVYPISEILQEVSQISTILIVGKPSTDTEERIPAEPFYGYFFTNLSKSVTSQIPTLAVALINKQMTLCINPNFWKEALDNYRYKLGGIKHEILHLVFDHVMASMRWSNKRLFNVAADLVVNQFIPRNQLLDGVVLLEKFPELNLLPFESSQYYYNRLLELYNEYSPYKNGEGDGNISWQNLQKFLGDDSESQEKHIYWEDIQKLSEAERKALTNQQKTNIRKIIKGSKMPGNFPNDFREDIENFDITQKPQLHWKDILRVFASNSTRTYIKNTLRRPSKRYGTSPGIKIAKKQKILVAIDTSGSIDQEQLAKFFEQVYHIWRQGVEVHVVECDTEIGRTYNYKGKLLPNMTGGGGTDFNDPIKYANEKYKPDAMIYFTDGYGDVPLAKPKCKMIWILIAEYSASPDEMSYFPGKKMYMQR